MDIVEFITARIADDEQRAKVAPLRPQRPHAEVLNSPTVADFVSAFDAAWTAAEILRSQNFRLSTAQALYADAEALAAVGDPESVTSRTAADAVAWLAARAYAEHPDFDPAWRIDD